MFIKYLWTSGQEIWYLIYYKISQILEKGEDFVGTFKKGMLTLLAICAFVLMSMGFFRIFRERLFPEKEAAMSLYPEAYPYAITQPAETLPTQTETQPPETEEEPVPERTQPPETEPPETVPPTTEPEPMYDTVPLFYMTDYPEIRYRAGTLATSGSNIASLAMVSSYLTGQEYRPDELADYFADYIGNSIQWLDHVSEELQLPWQRAENFHVAKQALQEGKLVITMMGSNSIFTQTEHFIVLTGINEDGRITVLDPYEPHYTQWNLETGLAEGFRDNAILTGYKGSWIYDPAAMPETPFVYVPAENTDPFRYPGMELTQEDQDLMAKLIYMEAASEPFEGQQAIAEVIFNRLKAGTFQSSIQNVIFAEGQFRSADRLYAAKPTHTQYEAIERAFRGPYVLTEDVVFFAAYPVTDNVWGTIGAHTFCGP